MRYIKQGIFQDGHGNVVSGGTVSVYLAGTTTVASVYAASSGGAAVNYVLSDSSGLFVFWVDSEDYTTTQQFKLVLSRANFISATYDDVCVFPDISGINDPYIDIRAYATDAMALLAGTEDVGVALQAAFDAHPAGCEIVLPVGTYTWSTRVYCNSATNGATYKLKGMGKGTILKPTGFTSGYALYLNEDSGANKIIALPRHPRLIVEDMAINATDSTSVSFLWYNEASFQFKNLTFDYILYGGYGTGYTDQISLDNIYWANPRAGGWIFRMGANGDSFYARQIFTTANNAIYLNNCAGGIIESVNGGFYYFRHCIGLKVMASHLEQASSDTLFTVAGSDVTFEKNYIWVNSGNPSIVIDDNNATSYREKSKVTLDNNSFIFDSTTADNLAGAALHIVTFNAYSRLILKNNSGYVYTSDRWIFDPIGMKMTSDVGAINTLFSDNAGALAGELELRYRNTAYELVALPPFAGLAATQSINTPAISSIATDTNFLGDLAVTTYYYKVATYTPYGNTPGSAEGSVAITATGQSMRLTVNSKAAPAVVRIWRGTSTGTYDRYVDIPVSVANNEIFDQGSSIAGYAWIDAGVPSVPTANTTYDGIVSGGYKVFYGTAAPTDGTWAVADRVYNTAVAAGGTIGWVCTTAGSPGTWKTFGTVQA